MAYQYTDSKWIITKDYLPLYAMRKCFGPDKGPLRKPTIAPIWVIKEILSQNPAPELFEVKPENVQLTRFTRPVKLTLENYTRTYDDLLAEVIAEESKGLNIVDIIPPEKVPSKPVETAPSQEPNHDHEEVTALPTDKPNIVDPKPEAPTVDEPVSTDSSEKDTESDMVNKTDSAESPAEVDVSKNESTSTESEPNIKLEMVQPVSASATTGSTKSQIKTYQTSKKSKK